MKIIKEGIDPKTIPLAGTCYSCKTEVEFLQSEAQHQPAYDQRDGEYWTITCPVCNGNIMGIKKWVK